MKLPANTDVIRISDDSKFLENTYVTSKPKTGYTLEVGQLRRDCESATVIMSAREFLKFLNNVTVAIPAGVDTSNTELPEIGQRMPTKSRINNIIAGWKDPEVTMPKKHENIPIHLFGVQYTNNSITFTDKSTAWWVDALGRTIAAMVATLEDAANNPVIEKSIVFNLIFDISGVKMKGLNAFYALNHLPKHTTTGTNMGVMQAKLSEMPPDEIKMDYENALCRAWIMQEIYKKPIQNTTLTFFPWNFEGDKDTLSESEEFVGAGRASSFRTTLASLVKSKFFKNVTIEPKNFPEYLHFGFTQIYNMCPEAVADSMKKSQKTAGSGLRHFHTSLSLKVQIVLIAKIYPYSGPDEEMFCEMVDMVIQQHYVDYRHQYHSQKRKKMDLDKFYYENKYLNTDQFHSSAVNTNQLIDSLQSACDNALKGVKKAC